MPLDDHFQQETDLLSEEVRKTLRRLPTPLVMTNLAWAGVAFFLLLMVVIYAMKIADGEGDTEHWFILPALILVFWRLTTAMNKGVELQNAIQAWNWSPQKALAAHRHFWQAQIWMIAAWWLLLAVFVLRYYQQEPEWLPDQLQNNEPIGITTPRNSVDSLDWTETLLAPRDTAAEAARVRRLDSIMRAVQESMERLKTINNNRLWK